MKFKEFLFHVLMLGSERRTQKDHKEEREVFFSTQNIDPGLFGQKEGLHLSIPRALPFPGLQPVGEELE